MLLSMLDRLVAGKLSAAAMALGVVAYAQGDRKGGARLMKIASNAAPRDAGLQCYGAGEAAKAGDFAVALRLWERAAGLEPQRADFAVQAAQVQRALGDVQGAIARCEGAIANSAAPDPGSPLFELLATLRMPGPTYLDNLAMIHAHVKPRSYVEIGVANGHSIALALPGTRAIGIDPAPNIMMALPAGTTIVAETSDAFFEANDLRALLGGLPVDLAFIDGMHQFEFALRDFINLERYCEPGSTIMFDDCWALDRRTAERDRKTVFWNGDVWRVLPALRKFRPELRIRTVATFPAGLCVVRGLDPASRVLTEHYDEIVREFGALDFAAFEASRDAYLAPIPNERDRVLGLFA